MRDSADSATVGSDEPRAYTVREAAARLSVGTRKVEYMVKSGELESVKIGRARRIPHRALVALLKNQQPAT